MVIPRKHAQLVGELLDEIARSAEHPDPDESLRQLIRGMVQKDFRHEALAWIRRSGRGPVRRKSDE